jgi:hypothetical protein
MAKANRFREVEAGSNRLTPPPGVPNRLVAGFHLLSQRVSTPGEPADG